MVKILSKLESLNKLRIWTIAYHAIENCEPVFKSIGGHEFKILKKNIFVTIADPFLFKFEGCSYLFYEKQNLFTMKGKIACVNLDSENQKSKIVLNKSFHLSYPFVFKWKGDIFMIPESKTNGKISLFRAKEFPFIWEFFDDIIELEAADTTTLFEENEWVIFTYCKEKLLIFYYDVKEKILTPHRQNTKSPKSSTVRPAGHFIVDSEELLRPSQNCLNIYGEAVIFNVVTLFNRDFYKEEERYRLNAQNINIDNLKIIGVHTYNKNGEYEVIDVRYEIKGIHIFIINIVFRCSRRIFTFLLRIYRFVLKK